MTQPIRHVAVRTATLCLLWTLLPTAADIAPAQTRIHGCRWSPVLQPSGFDGGVLAVASRREGDVDAIYVGGNFRRFDGTVVHHIARWNGSQFEPLVGPGAIGTDARVRSLVFFDDGAGSALYASGAFSTAGGRTVNRVARWDGVAWSPLAGPHDVGLAFRTGPLEAPALAVWDDGTGPALYVAGTFDRAGGVYVNGIARWDGRRWSAVGDPAGPKNRFVSLYPSDEPFGLFAGSSDGPVKRWDGSSWSDLPPIPGDRPITTAMAAWDAGDGGGRRLYAVGESDRRSFLMWWDGAGWNEIPFVHEGVFNHRVTDVAVYDGALVLLGSFYDLDGLLVDGIARWNGSSWSAVAGFGASGLSARTGQALTVGTSGTTSRLLVGGLFLDNVDARPVPGLAVWDGSDWSTIPSQPPPNGLPRLGSVRDLVPWDDGSGSALLLGGSFRFIGDQEMTHAARWDGHSFSPLAVPRSGTATDGIAEMAVWDDGTGGALFASGYHGFPFGGHHDALVRWDGEFWESLGTPQDAGVLEALEVWDHPDLGGIYVGGTFPSGQADDPHQLAGLARWDGQTWTLAEPPAGEIDAVWTTDLEAATFGSRSELYALAAFLDPGLPVDDQELVFQVGRWTGERWQLLPNAGLGEDWLLLGIEILDLGGGPTLFASTHRGVRRWTGSRWLLLEGGGYEPRGAVHAMAVWNHGFGPVLVAAEAVRGGSATGEYRISQWDGREWRAFGEGVSDDLVEKLRVIEEDDGPALYAAGRFRALGSTSAAGLARWTCRPACADDPDHTLCLAKGARSR